MTFRDYYSLTKGGLVMGNAIPVAAGFLLGAQGGISYAPFAGVVIGMILVMGSGCVFNNYIDRDIDGRMARTRDRALVAGRVSGRNALIFGATLGVAGLLTIAFLANSLALGAAAFGFFFYVVVYSLWAKRRTAESTIVGSLAGAVPPVAGYVAAAGRLDAVAAILFGLMVLWQIPHFYAIAIRRADDYAAAGVPVLPNAAGVPATKRRMLFFIVAFTCAAPLLSVYGDIGYTYFFAALILGLFWLMNGTLGLAIRDRDADILWARKMFLASLIVMTLLFVVMGAAAVAKTH